MKKIFALLFIFYLVGCGKDSNSSGQSIASNQQPEVKHYYSAKEGSTYGYKVDASSVASDDANDLEFFSYNGVKSGVYQITHIDQEDNNSGLAVVYECEMPCHYARESKYIYGKLPQNNKNFSQLKDINGSIVQAALFDAIAGELDVFVKDDGGKKYSTWYDAEKEVLEPLVD